MIYGAAVGNPQKSVSQEQEINSAVGGGVEHSRRQRIFGWVMKHQARQDLNQSGILCPLDMLGLMERTIREACSF